MVDPTPRPRVATHHARPGQALEEFYLKPEFFSLQRPLAVGQRGLQLLSLLQPMLQLLLQWPPQLILLSADQFVEIRFQTCRTGLQFVRLSAAALHSAAELLEMLLQFCWSSLILINSFIHLSRWNV